jgi:hypothetical protein
MCGEPIALGADAIYVSPAEAQAADLRLLLHLACAARLMWWLQEALGDLPEHEVAEACSVAIQRDSTHPQ